MALSIYDKFITDTGSGATLPNAQVQVTLTGSVSGNATLYADRDGLSTLPNPIQSDSDGRVKFYVVPGRYNITADYAGATINYDDVLITPEDTIQEYIQSKEYMEGESCLGVTDKRMYVSQTDLNVGNTPESDDETNWRLAALDNKEVADYAELRSRMTADKYNPGDIVYNKLVGKSGQISLGTTDNSATGTGNSGGTIISDGTYQWDMDYEGDADLRWFDFIADGVTENPQSLFTNIGSTGLRFKVAGGSYLLPDSAVTLTNAEFSGDPTGEFLFQDNTVFISSGIPVDLDNVVFSGQMTDPQMEEAITASQVETAFDTPTYYDGSDVAYGGGDFTHTKAGTQWTLSLAALTGDTKRSFESDYIVLDNTLKYVIQVSGGILSETSRLSRMIIRRYDGSNTYLGDWDPSESVESPVLKDTHKIKLRIVLLRTSKCAATNGNDVIDVSKIQLFKLINDAATADLDTGYDSETHFQIGSSSSPKITNCTFKNMKRAPLSIASTSDPKVENNTVLNCWAGFGFTNTSDGYATDNTFDLRQSALDGTLYNLKFLRHRGIGGSAASNLTLNNNKIKGASWGIELINGQGLVTRYGGNTIEAEHVGISSASGKDVVFSGENNIRLSAGWPLFGIELAGTHQGVAVNSAVVKAPGSLSQNTRGISISVESDEWEGGKIDNCSLDAVSGIYISSGSQRNSTIEINGGTISYNACGIFNQLHGVKVRGAQLIADDQMLVSYITNTAISCVNTSQQCEISCNGMDAGVEGAMILEGDRVVYNNNDIEAAEVLPNLIYAKYDVKHLAKGNTFYDAEPVAYYSGSGTGVAVAHSNVNSDGIPVLLGSVANVSQQVITATGVGGPAVHTITFTLPEAGNWAFSTITRIGGDANHQVMATYQLYTSNDVTNDLTTITRIGSLGLSSGSSLVGSATYAVSYNVSTKLVTITLTQSGGASGAVSTTNLTLRNSVI